jgi:hypothetical protein
MTIIQKHCGGSVGVHHMYPLDTFTFIDATTILSRVGYHQAYCTQIYQSNQMVCLE